MSIGAGEFSSLPASTDTKRLEASLSFIAVREMISNNDIFREIKSEICLTRRRQVESWLTLLAGGDNPYISQTLFGRGHIAVKGSAAVYVSQCEAVDVRKANNSVNCTVEIPATYLNKSVWVDPITYVIQKVPTVRICDDLTPPRYLIGKRWFCSYPNLVECKSPEEVAIQPIHIDDQQSVSSLHLGEGLYSLEQQAKFDYFVSVERARAAYLADTTHQAIQGAIEGGLSSGEWGSGLSQNAMAAVLDEVGGAFIPGYRFLGKPLLWLMFIIFVAGLVKLFLTVLIRVFYVVRIKGCGPWILAGFWGTLFNILLTPARLVGEAVDHAVIQAFPCDDKEAEHELGEVHGHGRQSQRERLYPAIHIVNEK